MPWAGSTMSSGMQTWTPSMALTMSSKPGEVDDDEVVDEDPGELLELLDGAGRAADGERLVPHHVGARRGSASPSSSLHVRPVDEGVARDADAVRRLPVRREVEQDRGVGPLAAAGEVVDVVALAVAGVGAHHQDVERLLGPSRRCFLSGRFSSWPVDVDHVEVAVEVAVEVDHAEPGRQADRDEAGQQHLADGVVRLGPRPTLAAATSAALGVVRGRRRRTGLGRLVFSVLGHASPGYSVWSLGRGRPTATPREPSRVCQIVTCAVGWHKSRQYASVAAGPRARDRMAAVAPQ